MLYIYAVHKNRYTDAIERLKYLRSICDNNSCELTKKAMIDYIERHPNSVKTMYFKNNSRHEGEYVHVVDHEYLRTDSNSIKADNLGELIEY